jgi:hypothetical protein
MDNRKYGPDRLLKAIRAELTCCPQSIASTANRLVHDGSGRPFGKFTG